MKYRSLSALGLAGALLFTLAACSPKEPEATPTPEALPSESMNVITPTPEALPSESMNIVTPEPTETPETQPTESVNVITPEESDAVVKPLESQTPVVSAPPSATPAPTATPGPTAEPSPEPTPVAQAPTAKEGFSAVSAKAGGTAMIDASFALDAYYPTLSEADFEDFVLYMPDASAKIEEILVGKVAAGQMDAVKAACESRQQGMKEEAAEYATTGDYVDSYQLVTVGDWILFCVCSDASGAASAFRDAVQ